MKKLQLKSKKKRLNLKVGIPKLKTKQESHTNFDDLFINTVKNISQEEDALISLLRAHETINTSIYPTRTWLSINEFIPPNTNQEIIVHSSNFNFNTIYVSHTFLQHYLLAKYLHSFKVRALLKDVSHFMILDKPES